jgi:hypothetical protein
LAESPATFEPSDGDNESEGSLAAADAVPLQHLPARGPATWADRQSGQYEGGACRGGLIGKSAADQFHGVLDVLAADVRDGAFPARPGEFDPFYRSFDSCSWCPFDRVCGRLRDDLRERIRVDGRVSRYARLAEPPESHA